VEHRRNELKKQQKEKQEDTAAIELSSKTDKKCQRFEKDLKENARDMQKMQMFTTLIVGVSSAAVFYLLNRRYVPFFLPHSLPPSLPLLQREHVYLKVLYAEREASSLILFSPLPLPPSLPPSLPPDSPATS